MDFHYLLKCIYQNSSLFILLNPQLWQATGARILHFPMIFLLCNTIKTLKPLLCKRLKVLSMIFPRKLSKVYLKQHDVHAKTKPAYLFIYGIFRNERLSLGTMGLKVLVDILCSAELMFFNENVFAAKYRKSQPTSIFCRPTHCLQSR